VKIETKLRKIIGYTVMSIAISLGWCVLVGIITSYSGNDIVGLLGSSMIFIAYFGIKKVNKNV